ncbi:glycosyltransferase [Candidatus Peregrinibacteria bacterium]|nr:glycosyltransferase [Candidatus Peregrinibacteria bacterium]
MKKILIIGNSPLPDENTRSRPAAGLRTHQFSSPLLKKGGTVISDAKRAFSAEKRQNFSIRTVNIAMPECYDQNPGRKEIIHSDKYSQFVIPKNDPGLIRIIQDIHDKFHPDAIIGVNTYPSYIASQIKSRSPLWADLNGWVMAEAQAQAYKIDSNDYISHYYKMEKSILKRADKISAVSETQRFSVIGELAFCGRLNKESFGYKFVHHIPNGTQWFEGENNIKDELKVGSETETNAREILKKIPENAFVLLWLGGYNTWVDEYTLFKSVEDAVKECKNLYFVSTGGEIKGLDNKTFTKFMNMIDKSKFKDRFIFLGWVDTEVIPYIYKRADCGLNVDRICTETLTGARNRINEMMKFGLPVITTLGSEISYEVPRIGAGIGIPSGKHEKLSEAIVAIYKEWRGGRELASVEFKKYGENGQKYIEEKCNYEYLMKPLMEWLENPRPAPDRGVSVRFGRISSIRGGVKYIKDKGLLNFIKKLLQKFRRG